MQLKDIFKRLGYPKHSDTIYEVLTQSKETLSVSALAEQCGVSRVVVYRCVEKLEEDDLIVRDIVGRRTYYKTSSPHKLTEAMRCVEDESAQVVKQHIQTREKDVPHNVRFLHGARGIREAFDDVITHTRKGDTFFRYTSERDLEKVNAYLSKEYRLQRDQKKLERLVISNPVSGTQKKSRLERFIKYIPTDADQFEHNIVELIYGSRVCIIDLNLEEVMIIDNQQLADFQKVIFKLLYKRLSNE